jgi:hypothetical protein
MTVGRVAGCVLAAVVLISGCTARRADLDSPSAVERASPSETEQPTPTAPEAPTDRTPPSSSADPPGTTLTTRTASGEASAGTRSPGSGPQAVPPDVDILIGVPAPRESPGTVLSGGVASAVPPATDTAEAPPAPGAVSERQTGGGAPPPSVPRPSRASDAEPEAAFDVLELSLAHTPQVLNRGEVVIVDVVAASEVAILDAPLHLRFDPSILEFVDASAGGFLTADGSSVVFLVNADSRPGEVSIGIGRTDRGAGASGDGVLCRIRLMARSVGVSPLRIERAMAWAADGQSVSVVSAGSAIEVQ